ncbi:hypothetical protein BH11PLA2_BH11PLA2_35340 [soil metagenome]
MLKRLALTAVLFAAVPMMAFAQAPAAGPAGTLQTAPLGKVLTDIRAAANLVAGDVAVKGLEDALKTALGEKGFSGLDLSKPMVGYTVYDAKNLDNVSFCLMAPITKEEDFLDFLKRCHLEPEEVKGEKNLYKLGEFDLPTQKAGDEEKKYTVLCRISGKMAYIGFNLKAEQLDPAKAYTFEQVYDAKETALFAFKQYHDRMPAEYAKNAMKQYDEMMEGLKKQFPGGDDLSWMKGLSKVIATFAKLTEEAKESGVRLSLNTENGELVFDSYYTPKPGTELAKTTAARAPATNAVGSIIGKDTVAGITLQLPVGMKEVQELILSGLDKAKEEMKKDPPPPFAKDLVDEIVKGTERTIKSGTWDHVVAVNGPDKDGHFVGVFAMNFEDAVPVEKAIKANLKDFPAEFRENVKLDVDKIGDVNIHSFDPPVEGGEPEGYARVFGDRKVYFAFGPKGVYAAVGNGAKDALKTLINGKPANAKAFDILINPKKGTQLAAAIEPNAGAIAEKILGSEDKLSSAMSYSLEGGESLKFKFAINLKMIPHWIAQGAMAFR